MFEITHMTTWWPFEHVLGSHEVMYIYTGSSLKE